jgi:hypothetical protein
LPAYEAALHGHFELAEDLRSRGALTSFVLQGAFRGGHHDYADKLIRSDIKFSILKNEIVNSPESVLDQNNKRSLINELRYFFKKHVAHFSLVNKSDNVATIKDAYNPHLKYGDRVPMPVTNFMFSTRKKIFSNEERLEEKSANRLIS